MEFVLKFPFKRACDRLMACLKMCFPRQVFDLLDFSIHDLLDFLVNRAEHLQAMRTTPASIPNSLNEHLLGSVIPYSGLTWARLHHSCKLVTRLGSPCDPIIYQRLHHSWKLALTRLGSPCDHRSQHISNRYSLNIWWEASGTASLKHLVLIKISKYNYKLLFLNPSIWCKLFVLSLTKIIWKFQDVGIQK